MDENMYRQRIQSLEEHTDKLVERGDKLAAQLAERDAEIADLRDNLQIARGSRDELRTQNQALMTENVALRKRVAEADQIVRAGEAERKALAAQVAELQRWRDAVPVDAIAFLVGATEGSLGISWQTRYVAEWANKMFK